MMEFEMAPSSDLLAEVNLPARFSLMSVLRKWYAYRHDTRCRLVLRCEGKISMLHRTMLTSKLTRVLLSITVLRSTSSFDNRPLWLAIVMRFNLLVVFSDSETLRVPFARLDIGTL